MEAVQEGSSKLVYSFSLFKHEQEPVKFDENNLRHFHSWYSIKKELKLNCPILKKKKEIIKKKTI
jgi:hypothetical protein